MCGTARVQIGQLWCCTCAQALLLGKAPKHVCVMLLPSQPCPAVCRCICTRRAVYSAHMREKALEALLWFTQLPAPRDRPPLLAPSEMVQWMSTGGGEGPLLGAAHSCARVGCGLPA